MNGDSQKRNPSNFDVIQKEYQSLILDIRDGDSSGQGSTLSFQRKTILFQDGTKLFVTEHIRGGFIERFYYDWIDTDGRRLAGFHNEPHEDKRYQTASEPYHIHPPDHIKITNFLRLSNDWHRDLLTILELIAVCSTILEAKKL